MQEATTSTLEFPSTTNRDALTEVVHRGAQRMLAELEAGDSVSLEYQVNDQLELFGELSTVSPMDLTL